MRALSGSGNQSCSGPPAAASVTVLASVTVPVPIAERLRPHVLQFL